ncbi:hypothetical protein D3C80_1821160 [compost metagenome]
MNCALCSAAFMPQFSSSQVSFFLLGKPEAAAFVTTKLRAPTSFCMATSFGNRSDRLVTTGLR